ncbi:hypothetical protein LCGC14_1225780 [marine sediment metagenome]|uniref:Uncharacterized protein n=1 Tax=marine sediment metagenome TaxID=412755 RepID=A0A0F9NS81_9ZZZZ
MLFKGKNLDYEINFEANVDLGYWALPVSICFILTPAVSCLDGGRVLILRVLCFQFSLELWEWKHEVIDVGTSIEDIIDG